MKSIIDNMKKKSIRKQIQITIIVISIFSTLLLGSGSYMVSKYTIEKNYRADFKDSLDMSNSIMNFQINDIVSGARELLTNENLINVLKDSKTKEQQYFDTLQSQKLEKVLNDMIYQNEFIAEATVIDKRGKRYSYHKNLGVSRKYSSEDILGNDWVLKVNDAKGKEIFFTYNVLDVDKNDIVFSMGKQLRDINTDNVVGYLVINIRKNLFDNALIGLKDKHNNSFFISDYSGNIAYFTGDEKSEKEIMREYINVDGIGNSYVFATAHNSLLGWDFVNVIKRSDLLGDSNIIGMEIFLMIILILFIGTLVSNIISGKIYRPLNQLSEMIKQVGEGKRSLTTKFEDGEIGEIGEQFKEMVNNNLELHENLLISQVKEREAELLLIQSQINPHFLYNTLDSIYCMAVIERQDNIAKMTESLSKMFRLSLNNGDKLVRVCDEIAHISAYMDIQNYRFLGRYRLILDVPQEFEDIYMLKFVLQPFVENAMYHGLEPKLGSGTVKVSMKVDEKDMFFYVEDDGVGMSDTSLAFTGYGIRNVSERIKLYYGEDCGVSFESKEGVGTRVTIKIMTSVNKGVLQNV